MPTYKDVEPIIKELRDLRDALGDKALSVVTVSKRAAFKSAISIIDTAPAADPVHTAGACYCKECKHCFVYRPDAISPVRCSCLAQLGRAVPEDGFCYHGEKVLEEQSKKQEENPE